MGYELPEKLKNRKAYQPVCGELPIRLDANESFLPLPEEILEEISQALKLLNYHRYPDPRSWEVCEAFGALMGVSPDCITAGNGSDELISLLLSHFAQPGDSVLMTGPDFSMYEFYAAGSGLRTVILEKEELCLEKEKLIQKAEEENCRIVIFSNPCNPTSMEISKEDILDLARRLDCLVVIDEAYMDFSRESVVGNTEEFDNLVVLKTCSKAIGLAGIRLGFAVSNLQLTGALQAVKSPYNVNLLTQTVGKIVLSHREYLQECVRKILRERDELYHGMKVLQQAFPEEIFVYPASTNFIFLKAQKDREMEQALRKAGIAVRHMNGFLRISVGKREENSRVLEVLEECLRGFQRRCRT